MKSHWKPAIVLLGIAVLLYVLGDMENIMVHDLGRISPASPRVVLVPPVGRAAGIRIRIVFLEPGDDARFVAAFHGISMLGSRQRMIQGEKSVMLEPFRDGDGNSVVEFRFGAAEQGDILGNVGEAQRPAMLEMVMSGDSWPGGMASVHYRYGSVWDRYRH